MLVALSFKVLLCDGRFPSYQFLGIGQVVVCDFIISGIIKYVKCAIVVRYASRYLCCCHLNLSKQLLLRWLIVISLLCNCCTQCWINLSFLLIFSAEYKEFVIIMYLRWYRYYTPVLLLFWCVLDYIYNSQLVCCKVIATGVFCRFWQHSAKKGLFCLKFLGIWKCYFMRNVVDGIESNVMYNLILQASTY